MPDIADVGCERICRSDTRGVAREVTHGASAALGEECQNAQTRGKQEQRRFLPDQPPAASDPGARGKSTQGPDVQQQQRHGQADEHRLCHQPEDKGRNDQKIFAHRRSFDVGRVPISVNIQKNVLRTSLRSATQATDSTVKRVNCKRATAALRQVSPVIHLNT